ncbi:MAG: ATP-binding cassette domain-containing protein [Elusimicrobia bacterium]|nr:ATP-binding cassette domain-containing protein [Elusimicrobiota bacterium]
MAQAPLLELQGIEKSFGPQKVLKGISLQVYPGEFLTFLGPSGCGKTTTLRIIGGFDWPDDGRVFLKGRDVTSEAPYARDVHTVFQHYALFPHYDVFDNTAFGLRIQRRPEAEVRQRVLEALDLVKLSGFESRRIDQLSGGQQQRVALARAIVGRPSLLLLDEPLGALDLKLRRQMQLELKGIQRRLGIAFIYVTHDQEEALTLSDRIAVFNAGEIEQLGGPREIYEKPQSSFVADFIGSANILDGEVLASGHDGTRLMLEGEVEVLFPQNGGSASVPGKKLSVAIRPERIHIHGARPSSPQEGTVCFPAKLLENVYLGASRQFLCSPFPKSGKVLTAVTTDSGAWAGADTASDFREVWVEFRPSDLRILQACVAPSRTTDVA